MDNKKTKIVIHTDTETETLFYQMAGKQDMTADGFFRELVKMGYAMLRVIHDNPAFMPVQNDGKEEIDINLSQDEALRLCRTAHKSGVTAGELFSEVLADFIKTHKECNKEKEK